MVFVVYIRDECRNVSHRLVNARTRNEAYEMVTSSLIDGSYVTAVYRA